MTKAVSKDAVHSGSLALFRMVNAQKPRIGKEGGANPRYEVGPDRLMHGPTWAFWAPFGGLNAPLWRGLFDSSLS